MTNGNTSNGNNKNGSTKEIKNPIKILMNLAGISYKEVARSLDISERTLISWLNKDDVDINYSYIVTLSEFIFPKILPKIIKDICEQAFYVCPSEVVWCFIALNDYFFSGVKQIILFQHTAYRHFFKKEYGENYLFFNDYTRIYSSDINIITKCFRSCENIICTGRREVAEENKKYIPENRCLFVDLQYSMCRIPFCVESPMGLSPIMCLSLDNRLKLNSEAEIVWKSSKENFLKLERAGAVNKFEDNGISFNEEEITYLNKILEDKYQNSLKNFFNAVTLLNKQPI